jgi:hypothetical protein
MKGISVCRIIYVKNIYIALNIVFEGNYVIFLKHKLSPFLLPAFYDSIKFYS